jgi:hypothetical protein
MSRRREFLLASVIFVTFSAVLLPSRAMAEEEAPPRFEIAIGLNRALALLDGSYASSYTPPSAFPMARASAAQALTLKGEGGLGVDLGLRYFPSRRAGVEVRLGYLKSHIGGKNDSYNYFHQYVPRTGGLAGAAELTTLQGAVEWPDTEGRLRQVVLGLNGVTRFKPAERVAASVSGGLSYFRFTGSLRNLGFTSFESTGTGSLAVDQYRMALGVQPAGRLGWNAGAEWDFAVTRSLAVVVDCRYYHGGAAPIPVHVEKIVSASPVTKRLGLKQIESALAPAPLELDPSFSRILFGLKYRR